MKRSFVGPMLLMAIFAAGMPSQVSAAYNFGDYRSETLAGKGWDALKDGDLEAVLAYTNKCIELYADQAKKMQSSLAAYPTGSNDQIFSYWALNDVAAGLFIQGEAYRKANKKEEALAAYKRVVNEFSYAQYWDPKGWFWKPADAAADMIAMMDKGLDFDFGDYRSVTLVVNAWKALEEGKLEEVLVYTDKCAKLYSREAAKMQKALKGYPEGSDDEIFAYWALNDVATAYFIQGEAYHKKGEAAKAREAWQKIIDEFSYGQCWDPKGWFWKPAEAAANRLNSMEEDTNSERIPDEGIKGTE